MVIVRHVHFYNLNEIEMVETKKGWYVAKRMQTKRIWSKPKKLTNETTYEQAYEEFKKIKEAIK